MKFTGDADSFQIFDVGVENGILAFCIIFTLAAIAIYVYQEYF
jgi:hypothetical protein